MWRRIKFALEVIIFLSLTGFLMVYLVFPSPPFPAQLPDSVQSLEDADTETPLKRAYFTNFSSEEVMEHYRNQFTAYFFMDFLMPLFKLNHPPEDAFGLIRDQTRSTFLEELVHPFRESLFVNGFKPILAKDDIWYKGRHFNQKITVKYVPSSVLVRIPIAVAAMFLSWVILHQSFDSFLTLVREWKKK